MSEKSLSLGSGQGFASNVLASIVAAIIVALGSLMSVVLATWLKGIPDLYRGILWGVSLTLFLYLIVFASLWMYWRLSFKGKGWESGIYACGPSIVLHKTKGFHTKQVGWYFGQRYFEADVLGMTIVNCGKAGAESLQVRFKCEGAGVNLRRWLTARLDTSKQLRDLLPGEDLELIFNLEIGKDREVNLVVKEPQSDNCFLFNNESYSYPRAQNPAWKMAPGKYRILVEVMGLYVLERFECVFRNQGRGTLLRVKSFRSVRAGF